MDVDFNSTGSWREELNVTIPNNEPLEGIKFFFKFATTLADLLFFIGLMLHLSHVKQMYSQTIHLTHELKSCMQI